MPWLFSALHLIMNPDITPLWYYSERKSACSSLLSLTNRLSLFWYSVCSCGWYETPTVAEFRQPVWYLSTHKFGLDACCFSYPICPPNTQWSIGNSKIANPHCSGFKYLQICILSKNVSANPKKSQCSFKFFYCIYLFIGWGVFTTVCLWRWKDNLQGSVYCFLLPCGCQELNSGGQA